MSDPAGPESAPRKEPGFRLAARPLAVLDIGSNSARVVVYALDAAGTLQILATSRAALRLVRDVDEKHRLGGEATERALAALADFRAIAVGAGASRIVAVATAAMRDAEDGALFTKRVRDELGIDIEIIDGEQEADYGLAGGLYGVPADDGLLFDLGGGSLQVIRFRHRAKERAWSFPLGSLRVSRAFLQRDPPSLAQVRRLVRHVKETLEPGGLGVLRRGEVLVGTGGTVRNLAKMDRRTRDYPITRIHGYELKRTRLHRLTGLLAVRSARRRDALPGLSGDRADSIAGGALVVDTLLAAVGASELWVSGQGVREGLAARFLGADASAPPGVRERATLALAARFGTWSAGKAERRRDVATRLFDALEPRGEAEVRDALGHAAYLLDIGRAVDFFERHAHAADAVLATELFGFAHRAIALVSAILRSAGSHESGHKRYAPLLGKEDAGAIVRAGVLLALADDIEERCPPGSALELTTWSRGTVLDVAVSTLAGWRPRGIESCVQAAFSRTVRVHPGRAEGPTLAPEFRHGENRFKP